MNPQVTCSDRARRFLDGRPFVLRVATRNGCCGGQADVPVADVGPPSGVAGYTEARTAGQLVYVEAALLDRRWHVDAAGLGPFTRLFVEEVEDR